MAVDEKRTDEMKTYLSGQGVAVEEIGSIQAKQRDFYIQVN
jgi:hypothetical protein